MNPMMMMGGGMGGAMGEVRFENALVAQTTVGMLNGSMLGTGQISVALDPNSKDGVKVLVSNLPAGIGWQDLKDHCAQVGTVAFCNVTGGGGGGGGGKAAGGMMGGMGGMGGMMMGGMGGMNMGGMNM